MRVENLSDLRSILVVNDFIARRPERVRIVLEEEEQNRLWQLSLYDLSDSKLWQVGHYIDGYEDRRVIYDKILMAGWSGYYEDDGGKYDVKSYVIKLEDDIVINLPDEWRPEYIIRTRRLCGYGFPLLEPVYFTVYNNEYLVLNCLHGLHRFGSFDEMASWVREQECRQHETPIIHWYDWGIILHDGRTILHGYSEPTADEVIQFLRQNLRLFI